MEKLMRFILFSLVVLQGTWSVSAENGSAHGSRELGSQGQQAVLSNVGRAVRSSNCEDSCIRHAKNRICEDGSGAARAQSSVAVYCDLGTDCSDCGPWNGELPLLMTERNVSLRPIEYLKQRDTIVYAKTTSINPPFVLAYTDKRVDHDVSEQVERTGLIEGGIVKIFHAALTKRCMPDGPGGKRGLVLDVGANLGFFALYAAKLGCRVIAWEPVPRFLAYLRYAAALNGVSELIEVRAKVVSDQAGRIRVSAPTRGNWGIASVASASVLVLEAEPEYLEAEAERLDDVVGPDEEVLLLKVDVEGLEPLVFRGAEKLLAGGKVENIVLEYSPGVAELLTAAQPANAPVKPEDFPNMLSSLLKTGYRIGHLFDNFAKSGDIRTTFNPMPAFSEVQQSHLDLDLADAIKLSARQLNCPVPASLANLNPRYWYTCNWMPEDAHPKGLRIMFAFNTNLWASRNPKLLKLNGGVGLFAPDQDMRQWWSPRTPEHGAGWRSCQHLEPRALVRNRCRCTNPICKAEEEEVDRLIKEGLMPGAAPAQPVGQAHATSGSQVDTS